MPFPRVVTDSPDATTLSGRANGAPEIETVRWMAELLGRVRSQASEERLSPGAWLRRILFLFRDFKHERDDDVMEHRASGVRVQM